MPNRLGVFPGVPAVEIQVGLISSTEDHAEAVRRVLAEKQELVPSTRSAESVKIIFQTGRILGLRS
jgi:hypothetical protein